MMNTAAPTTIAAIATPSGLGGVGVVRVSGPEVKNITKHILGKTLKPRYAHYTAFLDQHKNIIDTGLALYFPAPNSFTGEEVLELQGHGGPVILNALLKRVIELGAQFAKPGEFSERAFLNNKIDLVQAEAIADLIAASSEKAAMAAQRSLQGEFSKQITALNEKIIYLRLYVEAAIDFPEEEIDFLNDGHIKQQFDVILTTCAQILEKAKHGVVLQEGIQVVLAGEPNAGKSSLLNALAQKDAAIVTDIPGTTRDILREKINLDGVPLHIADTAGLRKTLDIIEQEGIKRAQQEIENADIVLWVVDSSKDQDFSWIEAIPKEKLIVVYNKIDLNDLSVKIESPNNEAVHMSVKNAEGFEQLKEKIFAKMGIKNIENDQMSARQRHLDILNRTQQLLIQGSKVLIDSSAGELVAEHLRHAHQLLGEITGEFTADDLLGEIFSRFCIGK